MEYRESRDIRLTDAVGRTVTIRKVGALRWAVRQRRLGRRYDNAQNPTWITIDNPGRERRLRLDLFWADTEWPHWRAGGYQQIAGVYTPVAGRSDPGRTWYHFDVPPGVSHFGAYPWHSNEETESFLARMATDPRCTVRIIGRSAQGRAIKRLTIGRRAGKDSRRDVVVFGRMHATETPGSFAVEGIADFLLNEAAGRRLLKTHTFHLFPNVNPDGAAAGLKLTRLGPRAEYDMAASPMTSRDASIAAVRRELRRLRPAALVDFHSYLFPAPAVFVLDADFGLKVLRQLTCGRSFEAAFYYRRMDPESRTHVNTFWSHCFLRYGTAVAVVELPWTFGRTPENMKTMGVNVLRAVVEAGGNGRRRR